ncbi:hypothetical protein B0H14DRAFT_2602420 [Mycena olivaceomarginata]|nr:hypothetical protein B0H14DRAFT_2602420 [Mycena olivaceomarginata]
MHLASDAQLYGSSGYHQIPVGEQFPGFGEPNSKPAIRYWLVYSMGKQFLPYVTVPYALGDITQKVQQSRICSRLVEERRGGYKNTRGYGDTANIKATEWTDRGVTRGRNDAENMVRYIGVQTLIVLALSTGWLLQAEGEEHIEACISRCEKILVADGPVTREDTHVFPIFESGYHSELVWPVVVGNGSVQQVEKKKLGCPLMPPEGIEPSSPHHFDWVHLNSVRRFA